MKFPRLPWGPEVPPAGSEESLKFMLRWSIACGLIGLTVGIIYATGIGKNHRTLGIAVIALSLALVVHAWWLTVRRRRQLRAQARNRNP
jgi:uncharacterized membrane protein YdjX (TVP38/TMEM64 family)